MICIRSIIALIPVLVLNTFMSRMDNAVNVDLRVIMSNDGQITKYKYGPKSTHVFVCRFEVIHRCPTVCGFIHLKYLAITILNWITNLLLFAIFLAIIPFSKNLITSNTVPFYTMLQVPNKGKVTM